MVNKKGTYLQRIPSSLLFFLYPPAPPDTPPQIFCRLSFHYSFWPLARQQTILKGGDGQHVLSTMTCPGLVAWMNATIDEPGLTDSTRHGIRGVGSSPALPFNGCVILHKLLNLSGLSLSLNDNCNNCSASLTWCEDPVR